MEKEPEKWYPRTAMNKPAEQVCGTKQSQTREELKKLGEAIQLNSELIENMRNKISSVIVVQPCDPAKVCENETALVPLAADIRSARYQVANNNNELRDMIASIEL